MVVVSDLLSCVGGYVVAVHVCLPTQGRMITWQGRTGPGVAVVVLE